MNGKRQLTYAPESRRHIVELYATGRSRGELAMEFGCSAASVHAWVKNAMILKPTSTHMCMAFLESLKTFSRSLVANCNTDPGYEARLRLRLPTFVLPTETA